jgi:hypothetical protein
MQSLSEICCAQYTGTISHRHTETLTLDQTCPNQDGWRLSWLKTSSLQSKVVRIWNKLVAAVSSDKAHSSLKNRTAKEYFYETAMTLES